MIFKILKTLHEGILGPVGDVAGIADLVINLRRRYDELYEKLPDSYKAHVKKGDSFQQFAQAVDELEPREQEAIRALLAKLRADQEKQERFIIRAVIHGGLGNSDPTVKFLKHLATLDTAEAIEYLEDLDFTQSSVSSPKHLMQKAKETATKLGKQIDQELGADATKTHAQQLAKRAWDWAKR